LANTNQEAVTQGDFLVECGVPSEMGKGYGGDGDAEEADGKLNETKGVVQAGDRSIGQVGGKVAIDHNVDLDSGGADGGGAEKSKYLFEAWIVPDEEPAGLVSEGDSSGNHDEPLGETADEYADGKTVNGALTESGIEDPSEKEANSDGDKVKGGGGKSGQTEVVEAVEETHIDGGKGEKEDEGKKDAGEFDGESDFSGDGGETWIEESDEGIGKDDPDSDDEKECDKEESVNVAGEAEGGCFALFGQFLREGGDEGGGESTFGKEITKEVWYAEGGDEGIELFAGSEESVEENFADEPENAGGSDGQHDAGGAFGAHFWFNLCSHAVRTSSGVRRVMQRRSSGQVLRKQGLQETLCWAMETVELRGPVQAGSVEPKMATAGLRRKEARCMGPLSWQRMRRAWASQWASSRVVVFPERSVMGEPRNWATAWQADWSSGPPSRTGVREWDFCRSRMTEAKEEGSQRFADP
jgi:hypothetical protein